MLELERNCNGLDTNMTFFAHGRTCTIPRNKSADYSKETEICRQCSAARRCDSGKSEDDKDTVTSQRRGRRAISCVVAASFFRYQ